MFSPNRRNEDDYDHMFTTPERTSITASPLKTIASPFFEAVKSAHSKATRDFDRFYENLQATLSPRTSEVKKRTKKKTKTLIYVYDRDVLENKLQRQQEE